MVVRQPADLPRIETFAGRNQLRVVRTSAPLGTAVLSGSLAAFAKAFKIQFHRVRLHGVECRGLSRSATLPAPLAARVAFILGLQTYPAARKGKPKRGGASRAKPSRSRVTSSWTPLPKKARRQGPTPPDRHLAVVVLVRDRSDILRLETFAGKNGLQVVDTYPKCRMVVLSGPVAKLNRAFGVKSVRVTVGGVPSRRTNRQPTLPTSLANRVVYIHGLEATGVYTKPGAMCEKSSKAAAAAANPFAVSDHVVPGSVPATAPLKTRAVGRTPNKVIKVTVLLHHRPQSASAAAAIAQAAYLSPLQRTYVTRGEFARTAGAPPADVASVQAFAAARGLTVVSVNAGRHTVELSGTAQAISAAFGVILKRYRHKGKVYRGIAGAKGVLVPTALGSIVQGVLGLENFPVARPHFQTRAGAGTSFTASRVADLYGFPAGVGKGQTIGIVSLGGGYWESDLKKYFQKLGIAAPQVKFVSVNGAKNSPVADQTKPEGLATTENSLDLQVAGAVAPGTQLVIYKAPNTDKGFLDAVTTAIHDSVHKPAIVSISWGNPESSWSGQAHSALNSAFQDAISLGVTVLAASGDNGSSDGVADGKNHVDFPASSPYVLGCGGTTLAVSGGQIQSETAWSGSGGGVAVFGKPTWQSSVQMPGAPSGGGRGVPDVCGNANPDSGYQIVVNGKATVVGGTSAVAPLWAALVAQLNAILKTEAGFLNALLYTSLTPGLRDITSGTNGAFHAHAGWDPVTGVGRPKGARVPPGPPVGPGYAPYDAADAPPRVRRLGLGREWLRWLGLGRRVRRLGLGRRVRRLGLGRRVRRLGLGRRVRRLGLGRRVRRLGLGRERLRRPGSLHTRDEARQASHGESASYYHGNACSPYAFNDASSYNVASSYSCTTSAKPSHAAFGKARFRTEDDAPPRADDAPPRADDAPPAVDDAPPAVDDAPPRADDAPPAVDDAPPRGR